MPSPLLAVEQACASLPRAVQPFVVLYRWVCRPAPRTPWRWSGVRSASPFSNLDLAPLRRGFFMRLLRAARNQQRGSALGWWVC